VDTVNILSGGAAQGLVRGLTEAFRAVTGFAIDGEFSAVGAMADKLRAGAPADLVILTQALVARLAEEKLVVAASRDPTIREFSTDRRYAVAVGRRKIEFRNTNSLVGNPTWDIVVQKTGYISEAGKCLVMQAVIDDRTVVMVLLNSYGRYTRVADAVRIRRWMEAKLAEHTAAGHSKI